VKVVAGNGSPGAQNKRLWDSKRIAIAATESGDAAGLRFSPHIYNTMDEIDEAVRAVRSVLA
jgi:selenocysteine lyase/cysteine desulfurase